MTRCALLVAALLLAAPAGAQAAVRDLGPAPYKCMGVGGDGCYAFGDPLEMDNTFVAELTAGSHVVRAGGTLTMNAVALGWNARWVWGSPGCAPSAASCDIAIPPNAAGTGWLRFGMTFPSDAGTGIEQDYYAIVGADEFLIEGRVQRQDPAQEGRLLPAGGVTVVASGAGGTGAATTNGNGVYSFLASAGSYSVQAAGEFCVPPATSSCTRTADVTVGPDRTGVDFVEQPYVTVRGTVAEGSERKPKPGITVTAGGRTDTTLGDGRYSIQLPRNQTPVLVSAGPNYSPAPGSECTVRPGGCEIIPLGDRSVSFDLDGEARYRWEVTRECLEGACVPRLEVQFDGRSSISGPGHEIVGWHWDFGDGKVSDVAEPLHEYEEDGPFTVKLTAIDDTGRELTSTRVVEQCFGDSVTAPTRATISQIGPCFDLKAKLAATDLPGDRIELALTLANGGKERIDELLFPGGTGLKIQGAGLELERGPFPAPPGGLAPGESATVRYAFLVTAAGLGRIESLVEGVRSDRRRLRGAAALRVEIAERDGTPLDQRVKAGDALSRLMKNYKRGHDRTQNKLGRWGEWAKKGFRGKQPQPTRFERDLAVSWNLAEDQLAFLPNDPKEALTAFFAYQKALGPARLTGLSHFAADTVGLGGTILKEGAKTSTRDLRLGIDLVKTLTRGAAGDARWQAQAQHLIDASIEERVGLKDGSRLLGMAAEGLRDPSKAKATFAELDKQVDQRSRDLERTILAADREAGKWLRDQSRRLARMDPAEFGTAMATVQGEVEGNVAGELLLDAAGVGLLKNAGKLKKLATSMTKTADVLAPVEREAVQVLDDALPAPKRPPGALTASDLAEQGYPQEYVDEIQGVVKGLEQKYSLRKRGLRLVAEFRAAKKESARLFLSGEGAGKDLSMEFKTLEPIDVVLGADPAQVGKAGTYRPKLPHPDFLKNMPPEVRKEFQRTIKFREAENAGWRAGKPGNKYGKLRAALSEEGAEYEVGQGRVVKLAMDAVESESGTTVFQLRDRQIGRYVTKDGKRAFSGLKAGEPGQWIVSDTDGHAAYLIDEVTGARVPFPDDLKGRFELDLMDGLRKANLPHGLHGFTMNGFDISSKYGAKLLKYLLEAQSEEVARKLAPELAKRFGLDEAQLAKLLNEDLEEFDQFVLKFTAEDVTSGYGALP